MGIQQTALPSELVSTAAVLAPVSSNAAQTSAYVDAALFRRFCATVFCGVLGASATVDFKLVQAKTSGGGSVKDIAGAAITQLVKATDDGKAAKINLNTDALDTANGFRYVAMVATVGTAASLVAAVLEGYAAFNDPASLNDATVVKQIVSV